jgi:hypothetical protein
MARPKGKLFALLAVFAAIGLVAASGAFTTVEADRTASVDVTGDNSALLKLDSTNSNIASTTSDDQLQLDFSEGDVNPNANTTYDTAFKVTNNGGSEVTLTISKTGANGNEDSLVLINASDAQSGTINSAETSITLSTGESYAFGVVIDTTSGLGSELGSSDSFDVTLAFEAS